MKLLFDQNLSDRLMGTLAAQYPGSIHVRTVGLQAADDKAVWNYAAKSGFAIVSKDADFEQLALLYGHPPKVVWIQMGNCTTTQIAPVLHSRQADLLTFDSDPITSLLVIP